jgi:hypothetical protein
VGFHYISHVYQYLRDECLGTALPDLLAGAQEGLFFVFPPNRATILEGIALGKMSRTIDSFRASSWFGRTSANRQTDTLAGTRSRNLIRLGPNPTVLKARGPCPGGLRCDYGVLAFALIVGFWLGQGGLGAHRRKRLLWNPTEPQDLGAKVEVATFAR